MATTPADLYRYRATLIQWPGEVADRSLHDGDTFAADIDLGFHVHWRHRIRCAGYNAPEINTLATRQAGTAARNYAESLMPFGCTVYLNSLAFLPGDEEDDFGRALAAVTLADGRDLAALMITSGHAVPDPI